MENRACVRGIGRHVLLVTAVFMFTVLAMAQETILHDFTGGNMDLNISLNSQLMTGPGIKSVVVGGVAPSIADPFTIFRNPAGMRYTFDRPHLGYTFHPNIEIEWPDQVQEEVDTQMDDFVADYDKGPDFQMSSPQISGGIGQHGSMMTALAMTFPKFPWQFGIGYQRPYFMRYQMLMGGLSQRIEATDVDNPNTTTMMQIKLDYEYELVADAWTVAVARDIGDSWTAGASLTRNYVSLKMQSALRVDGVMVTSDQLLAFNSPNDPWNNDLQGHAIGGYDGESWTLKLGTQYVPWAEDSWRFGADISLASNVDMTGNMDLLINEFPAMILSPSDDEEAFDINKIIDVSETTKTYPNEYLADKKLKIFLPSSIAVGVGRGSGSRVNLQYRQYFGKFQYELGMMEKDIGIILHYDDPEKPDKITSKEEYETEYTRNVYGIGFEPEFEAYLGLHPGRFFIGMGFIKGKTIVLGYKDSDGVEVESGETYFIPRFDFGFSIGLVENMTLDFLIDGIPDDFMRMGITYDF